jgi:two-component system, LytTR family, response regulator
MIKAIIIDDESKAIKSLQLRIERLFDDIEIVATAQSANDGKAVIDQHKPDLVFLDIEMPNGNAFALLKQFDSIDFAIIFVTAYNEYALQAIRISALDYILKPIDEDELVVAINKYRANYKSSIYPQKIEILTEAYQKYNSQSIRIALPTMGGIEYVHINQIVYCEADNNYSTIHLEGMPSILISKTLKFFEDVLKDFYFMRIHQSYLINLFKVVRFEKSNRGRVVLNNGATINLSKNKKEEFLEKISKLTRI